MSFVAAPLLERFPVFRSRSPEETGAWLQNLNFRFVTNPRQVDQLDSRLNGLYLPSLRRGGEGRGLLNDYSYLGYVEYGAPAEITATAARADYWIQFSLRGEIEVADGENVVACDTGSAAVISAAREPVIRSGPHSARMQFSATAATLVRQLAALLGEPVPAPIQFTPIMPIARGYGRSLVDAFRMAAADLQNGGEILSNPLTLSAFEQFILTGLLVSQPNNYSDALQRRAKPLAPRDVKRAIDFIEANLEEAIGLPEIVAASGIPGRTLLKHFRDFEGTSPMRYLRRARFQRVHQALRRAAPEEGVAEIAATYGFTHMGRFSVEYGKQFGESPSTTLRRQPR